MSLGTLRKLFDFRRLWRSTIARDLIVGIVLTLTVVFTFAGTVNYFYSTTRDAAALHEKATEIMDNLASVLVTPMWNLNSEELGKIVNVYRQSGIVHDIKLLDDTGEALVASRRNLDQAFLEMSRIIHHEQTPIGRVVVYFSDADIVAKQREIAAYSAIVFAFLTIGLVLATTLLLERFLKEPFNRLKAGLDVISDGDYTHVIAPVRQSDITGIMEKVNGMAREIARRESALEENRNKLEILNQAIMDIFSCSDTSGLVRTTLQLAHKVCGVSQAWFLGTDAAATSDDEEKAARPTPLAFAHGEVVDVSDEDIQIFVAQKPTDRVFTFELKSRYRIVGTLTTAFDDVPDPSVTSLLKSLMSLATLAMIRQSFIRETAFISAELQVAETVQRSMLPDEAKMPRNALVAYHYEPVLRVGGDWFSVIEERGGDAVYAILGDVTGHGLAQGLVTTATAGALQIVESMIQDFGAAWLRSPAQIVQQLDNVITRIAGKSNLRMTCVAVRIDFKEMKISICNAGHTFPILLRNVGDLEKVKLESLARNQQLMLGEEDSDVPDGRKTYSDATYTFNAADLLVLYTDGLTEAVDKDGKAFVRKFHRHFGKHPATRQAMEVKDDLMKLFRDHVSDVPVKDDVCVLVVGKKPTRATQAA